MNKARVFISCGQIKGSEEEELANRIKEMLVKFGFENDAPWPYVAIKEQTGSGVVEHIFSRLEESEYFIHIDLNREFLIDKKKLDTIRDTKDIIKYIQDCPRRGSLFTNQELAVAVFLKKRILSFIEKGGVGEDGISKYIQLNPILFERTRTNLLKSIEENVGKKIEQKEWMVDWRDELQIEETPYLSENILDIDSSYLVYGSETSKLTKFYHLGVKNLHYNKIAKNCVVFLDSWQKLPNDRENKPELIEFKWKSVTTPSVNIPYGAAVRQFDAFKVNDDSQHIAKLTYNRNIVDYKTIRRMYDLNGPGDFRLNFVVFSDNFSPVQKSFDLHLGNTTKEIEFKPSKII